MSTGMLIKHEHRASQTSAAAIPPENDEVAAAMRRRATRLRRLKMNVAAWALGTILLTTLWVVNEWQANGPFERFGHEGADGQWNPTLWALAVGIWGLIVGIMALRVRFERSVTRLGGVKFHIAAWVLGMVVLTPLWALIEWQDNGGFERFSNDSQPGEWEPWILYVSGIWALVGAILALRGYVNRPTMEVDRSDADRTGRQRV